MNTYEPAFVGLAHLMPDWKRWGFPNEQAYLSAGSPKTQYAQWQKQQQATPPPPAFPSTAERMGLTHPLPAYTPPPNAGQATASQELAEYGAPPAPKPDLSALYNPAAAAVGTSTISPPQQFAGTFMQPGVTAPAGSLRARAQATGAQDYMGIATGLQRINEATAIPGVTPFLRNTVAPAVGDVFAAPGELTGIQPLEDVGRFLGESVVPTTGLELGLEAIPGVGIAPDIARGARALARPTSALQELPMGAASSLVRGTPVDEGPNAFKLIPDRQAGEEAFPSVSWMMGDSPQLTGVAAEITGARGPWYQIAEATPAERAGVKRMLDSINAAKSQTTLYHGQSRAADLAQFQVGEEIDLPLVAATSNAGLADQYATPGNLRLRNGFQGTGEGIVFRIEGAPSISIRENEDLISGRFEVVNVGRGTEIPGSEGLRRTPDGSLEIAPPRQRLEVTLRYKEPLSTGPTALRPSTLLAGPGAGRAVPAPRPGLAGAALGPEDVVPPVGPRVAPQEGAQPPLPPTAVATMPTPQPDPLTRLTDLIDQARPLPAQTEAIRSAERAQRIAQSRELLEQGGFSAEAFQQAKAPLAGEYSRATFDPVSPQFAPEEIQGLRNQIRGSGLRTFEQINTNDALNAVLEGRLNEIRPFEIELLDRVYGSKLSLAVAQKAAPPSFGDKVYEWWLSSILSGPITQARNFVGNTAAAMTAPVERAVSAAIEPVARRVAGRETERFWQEVPEQVAGMMGGFNEGVRGAVHAIKGGLNQAALVESATKAPAISGLKGRIIRAPLTGLEAMDAFFGAINFAGARRALAVRQARKEGLKGADLQERIAELLADTPEDLIDAATQEKLVRLFRDDPTRVGQAVMAAREKWKPLRFLIPFARTPDRLLAYGIRRSPFGLLDFPMWQRLMKGNPQAVDELAATLMGSTVAMGFGGLLATGALDITGAVPTDPALRDAFYRTGKQPFSVKVPGVGWIQYSQIPGLDVTLAAVASVKESIDNGENPDQAVANLASNISQSIFEKSYVSGLADFMDIFASGGYENPQDAALRWAGRQASGAVPYGAAGRQFSQMADQTIYRPKGIQEELAAGIGLGGVTGVPERLTAFGEPATRPFPSPVTVSPDRQTNVDTELSRLGVKITFVGNSIGGRKLSRDEQNEYQRRAGQLTYDRLQALFETSVYQRMPDIVKEKTIENIKNQSREAARQLISLRHARETVDRMRQGSQR